MGLSSDLDPGEVFISRNHSIPTYTAQPVIIIPANQAGLVENPEIANAIQRKAVGPIPKSAVIHRSSDPSRAEVSVSDGVALKNIAVGSHQNGVLDPIGTFEGGQVKPSAVHDQVAGHFGVGQTPFYLNDGPCGSA